MVAQIAQRHARRKVTSGEHRGRSRDEHLATVGDPGDPRRAVHIDADVIRARCLAGRRPRSGVHPHPHPDDRIVREAGGRKALLRRRRRGNCLRSGREGHEQRVALDPHLVPLGERRPQDLGVHLEHLVIPVGPERGEQLGRTFDVGEQEGHGSGGERVAGGHSAAILGALARLPALR